jgi:hypothetical protein
MNIRLPISPEVWRRAVVGAQADPERWLIVPERAERFRECRLIERVLVRLFPDLNARVLGSPPDRNGPLSPTLPPAPLSSAA